MVDGSACRSSFLSALSKQKTCAGIGGDAFALMYKAADKSVSAIMGSGRSPRKMTLNVSLSQIVHRKIQPRASSYFYQWHFSASAETIPSCDTWQFN